MIPSTISFIQLLVQSQYSNYLVDFFDDFCFLLHHLFAYGIFFVSCDLHEYIVVIHVSSDIIVFQLVLGPDQVMFLILVDCFPNGFHIVCNRISLTMIALVLITLSVLLEVVVFIIVVVVFVVVVVLLIIVLVLVVVTNVVIIVVVVVTVTVVVKCVVTLLEMGASVLAIAMSAAAVLVLSVVAVTVAVFYMS